MTTIYNEIEPHAAEWLSRLIERGSLEPGVVDVRSIEDLEAVDANRAHFFAGIGGWPYALDLAKWPREAPVWTGSCPCQPFSAAGRKGGFNDRRHLWPEWFRLIAKHRPSVVFGEQIAGKAGLKWLDLVSTDLEGAGYAVGAANLPAASVGAPHLRQRLYFVALADGQRLERVRVLLSQRRSEPDVPQVARHRAASELGKSRSVRGGRDTGALSGAKTRSTRGRRTARGEPDVTVAPSEGGPWNDVEWLDCTDGKTRPAQRGLFPLADGVPGNMGRCRAYGNAIVPQVAAAFIASVIDIIVGDRLARSLL